MAGNPRAGNNSWWTTIVDLSLAAQATALDLYTNGINRLSDRTQWLLARIVALVAALASTSAGSKATVVGSVDLSELTYDPVTGTLNSLTFQTQADAGGVITTTFGAGGGAPTGPGDVVAAIAAAAGGAQVITEDAAGHLNVSSSTTGGGSTIHVAGGTAVTALGFTVGQDAAGVSSGADGISQIGGASVVGSQLTIPAGTLRSMLTYLANRVQGGTMTRVVNVLPEIGSGTWVDEGLGVWQNNTHTGDSLCFFLPEENAPQGSTLTGVTVYLTGAGGHTFPIQNMPAISVASQTLAQAAAVYTLISAKLDSVATAGAYQVNHTIAITGLATVVDRSTTRYVVVFTGESGTNALNGLQLTSVTTTWTL